MTWLRSDRCTANPPNHANPTPASLVECYGASLCSFGPGPSNRGERA